MRPRATSAIVQPCAEPGTVQVAPLVRLDPGHAREARDGKRPRYVHVPVMGEDAFADLDVVSTIDKPFVVTLDRQAGVKTAEQVRNFGRAVGRRPGRFPFPDEVVPWLQPLEKFVGSRSRKAASPEGQLLDLVTQFRIEASNGWRQPPYSLTLVVIVRPGVLPTFPNDEMPDCSAELAVWLYGDDNEIKVSSSQIAEKLLGETSNQDRQWLWEAVADRWASQCVAPPNSGSDVVNGVSSVSADVVSSDEYTLNRYLSSEQLDLDHLSAPGPT